MRSFSHSLTSRSVAFFGATLSVVSVLASPLGAQEQAAQPRHGAALEMMTQLQNVFADVAENVFPSVVIVTSYMRVEPIQTAVDFSTLEEVLILVSPEPTADGEESS